MGHEQVLRGKWEYLLSKDSGGCFVGKARRDMATRISLEGGSVASQKKCGYRLWPPNDVAKLPCNTLERIGRLGIVQEILRKFTDFLRRVIAPLGGTGGVTFVVRASALQLFSFGGLHLVGIDGTRRRHQ